MTRLTRRAVLASAAAGAAGLAGCLGGGSGSDGGDRTTTASSGPGGGTDRNPGGGGDGSGVRLDHIDLINRHDTAHTVHLQVERDGEVVYWDVHELAPPGGDKRASARVERTWPAAPATFTIEARVDDGEVHTQTYDGSKTGDATCLGVFADVDGDGVDFYNGEVECEAGGDTTTG